MSKPRGGRPPGGLTPEEAELWAKVAATVRPLHKRPRADAPPPVREVTARSADGAGAPGPKLRGRTPPPLPPPPARPAAPRPLDRNGLDATWDRKLARAAVAPDFTLDLHGHTLDAAHARLDHGLTQAVSLGARLVLLVTGRPRPSDDHASRGERRGAIRAKVLDWLAAGPHASRIAAVRPAHPKHGGAGAVYIVLRRPR